MVALRAGEGRKVPGNANSGEIVWKVTPEQTGGAYSIQEFTAPVGHPNVPPHIHETEEEAFFILEGETTFRIGDDTFRAMAGSFVLVPRGVIHSQTYTGNTTTRFLSIFSPPRFSRFFEERVALMQTRSGTDDADYSGITPEDAAALAKKYHVRWVHET
ncbi:MAG: cupin domain-containing protein [Thermomicrobiales bacterium]